MIINRGDVERYQEVFKLAKAAGWSLDSLKEGEGSFEVQLRQSGRSTTALGWWRGSIEEWRKFCALTTPPNAG